MTTSHTNLADLWAEACGDKDFRFQIKAQDIAVNINRALAEAGISRAELARMLGWRPSRVTHVLSGTGNLTLRTIFDITSALGLEFDVVLRKDGQQCSSQHCEMRAMLHDVSRLHETAQHHVTRAETLLDTARHLNRRAWAFASHIGPQRSPWEVAFPHRVSNGH